MLFSFLAIVCAGVASAQTTISITPSTLVFNATPRGPRLTQTIRVTSSVPGGFYINVTGGLWLSAPQDDFTTPMTVTISADPAAITNPTTLGGTLTFVGFGALSGTSANATVTLNVGTGPAVGGGVGAPVWSGPVAQSCQVNVNCSIPLSLHPRSGIGAVTFSLHSGSLPVGMTLTNGEALTGIPTATGVYTFRINATDTAHPPVSNLFTISVQPLPDPGPQSFVTTALPNGTTCSPYAATILSTGGVLPYHYGMPSGSLPPQLTMSLAGVISGSPSVEGVYVFEIVSADSFSSTHFVTRMFTLNILPCGSIRPLAILTTPHIPQVGCARVDMQLVATGGVGPYTWTVAANSSLPANLTLTSSGLLAGSSIAPGIYTFNINVRDSNTPSSTTTKTFTFEVSTCQQNPPLTITTNTLLPTQSGCSNISIQLQATGGVQPVYSWSIVSGSLPAPLTLSRAGLISGIPTPGSLGRLSIFTVQVQESFISVTKVLALTVNSCGTAEAVEPLEGSLTISPEGIPAFKLVKPAESDMDGTLEIFPANEEGEFAYFANALRQISFNIKAGTSEAVFPKQTGRLAMLSSGGAATVVPTLYRKGIAISPEANTVTIRNNGTVE